MTPLLLLLACGPKVPPEGSTELALNMSASQPLAAEEVVQEMPVGDAPLPLGTALPVERRGNAEAVAAYIDGEGVLQAMRKLEVPRNPAESHERAVKSTELAEDAIALFQRAAEVDPTLRAYSATRTGDAWRMAAAHTRQVQPPIHVPPSGQRDFENEQGQVAADLEVHALMAYQQVLADRTVDGRWLAHCRWAITQLPAEG